MTKQTRRLWLIGGGLAAVAGAVALVFVALGDATVYFYSPSDIETNAPEAGQSIRLGGLVAEGSLEYLESGEIAFSITDGPAQTAVRYRGALPDLFREGQGVVAQGVFEAANGVFVAREVLAKHDETYMPAEVVDALKRSGQWKNGSEEAGS